MLIQLRNSPRSLKKHPVLLALVSQSAKSQLPGQLAPSCESCFPAAETDKFVRRLRREDFGFRVRGLGVMLGSRLVSGALLVRSFAEIIQPPPDSFSRPSLCEVARPEKSILSRS